MKLNLLPTYVSREKQGRGAWVLFGFLCFLGLLLATVMIVYSGGQLKDAKDQEADARQKADRAKATSDKADAIMSDNRVIALYRNVTLAEEMSKHNGVYPDLYDSVRKYIPPYFRVTSMSATPNDASTSTVILTGVLTSYQQYADLMLALLRIPGATGVSRSGYQLSDAYVPALTPEDQTGRPVRPGELNVPDDPLERLNYYIAQGRESGYLNLNNYGDSNPDTTKGPMPNASLVTVQVTIPKDLRTPDPRQTLNKSGGAASTAANGAAAAFTPGGGPAGPGGGPGGIPAAPPSAGGTSKAGNPSGGGKGSDD